MTCFFISSGKTFWLERFLHVFCMEEGLIIKIVSSKPGLYARIVIFVHFIFNWNLISILGFQENDRKMSKLVEELKEKVDKIVQVKYLRNYIAYQIISINGSSRKFRLRRTVLWLWVDFLWSSTMGNLSILFY